MEAALYHRSFLTWTEISAQFNRKLREYPADKAMDAFIPKAWAAKLRGLE
jgi:hypothetical protein